METRLLKDSLFSVLALSVVVFLIGFIVRPDICTMISAVILLAMGFVEYFGFRRIAKKWRNFDNFEIEYLSIGIGVFYLRAMLFLAVVLNGLGLFLFGTSGSFIKLGILVEYPYSVITICTMLYLLLLSIISIASYFRDNKLLEQELEKSKQGTLK